MAVDDNGEPFELSPDPMLKSLCPILASVHLGDECGVEKILHPILEDPNIFGVDLYEAGLAIPVCSYFSEMIKGTGAVRDTLKKYVWL